MVRTLKTMPIKFNTEIINAAIEGFESQKRRIDDQIAELRAMLDGGTKPTATTPEAPTGKRKKFSASARRHMKEAQHRRWAKIRGGSGPAIHCVRWLRRESSRTGPPGYPSGDDQTAWDATAFSSRRDASLDPMHMIAILPMERSEERRVGKECRSR